jgi:predicted anti-sigma-YlaC factor YlaD
MKCKDVDKNLIFYLDGELSSEQEKEITEHLGQCSKCRKLYSRLAEVWGHQETEKIPYQPFFFTRVKEGVKNKKGTQAKSLKKYGKLILQPAIYFIVLGLGIFIGVQLGQGISSNPQMSDSNISAQQEIIEAYADSNYINGMQLETLENEMLAQENEKNSNNE